MNRRISVRNEQIQIHPCVVRRNNKPILGLSLERVEQYLTIDGDNSSYEHILLNTSATHLR